jgi:ADP-ribose pyrophosphatase
VDKKVKIISSKQIYKGKWLNLHSDKIIKPDGTHATHEVIDRDDGVLIIPKVEGKFLMVNMYRYPVNDYSLEFPMGFMDKQENPSQSAVRELREEAGLYMKNIEELGIIWAWSGLMNQKIHVFYSENFIKEKQKLDETESDLTVHFLDYKEILSAIKKCEIKNSATLAALSIYAASDHTFNYL